MELATASRLSRQPQRRLKTRPEVAVQRQTRGIHRMVTWWASDCLYLSEGARTAFKRMVQLASSHRELVHSYRGTSNQAGTRAVNDSWAQIMAVGQLLAEGAGCHLSDQVLDDLRGKALPEKKSGKD